jgi:predicted house-cleaning noncanonical NTP pyrophosphatase (MazG superfamily)
MIINHNKLVRDRIPEMITKANKKPKFRVLNGVDYNEHLKLKLYEEFSEYLQATNKVDQINEMADIFEVIYAIMTEAHISYEEVEEARCFKANLNGVFNDRIFLESVETYE